jgi:hypothetical protein
LITCACMLYQSPKHDELCHLIWSCPVIVTAGYY